MEPFLIFSLPRCGSNMLVDLINQCVPSCCAYEPFNLDTSDEWTKLALGSGVDVAISQLLLKFSGFKHVWNSAGWPFPSGRMDLNLHLVRSSEVRVVFLHRRNLLERLISEEIARQTGTWRSFSEKAIQKRVSHVFSPMNIASLQTTLMEELSWIKKFKEELTLLHRPWFDLEFECLYSPDVSTDSRLGCLEKIFGFLQIEDERRRIWGTNKLKLFLHAPSQGRSCSIYRQIPNIGEIVALGDQQTGFLSGK